MLEMMLIGKQTTEFGLQFLGEVLTADFIAGDALAAALGLTAGVAMNTAEPWLKFSDAGKILYIAKKPYRHTVNWNDLNAAGALTGTKTVNIGGSTYQVRTISGGASSPGTGSEWNTYMYPIHADDPSGTNLASYSNLDIGIDSSQLGYVTQCRDTASDNTSTNVIRFGTIATWNKNAKTTGGTTRGWRPILELVS